MYMEGLKLHRIQALFAVKRIIRKKQCRHASLKAHLHVLFWYGHETCCQILLKFFYGCKLITSEPNPQSLEGPDAAHSKIEDKVAGKWLEFGSSKTDVL